MSTITSAGMPGTTGITGASHLVHASSRALRCSASYCIHFHVGWYGMYTNYALSSNILPVILQYFSPLSLRVSLALPVA